MKTLAILPTARILLRMTSLRIAEVPPETSPQSKNEAEYTTIRILQQGLEFFSATFLKQAINRTKALWEKHKG